MHEIIIESFFVSFQNTDYTRTILKLESLGHNFSLKKRNI